MKVCNEVVKTYFDEQTEIMLNSEEVHNNKKDDHHLIKIQDLLKKYLDQHITT